jgi:hypothetical protein
VIACRLRGPEAGWVSAVKRHDTVHNLVSWQENRRGSHLQATRERNYCGNCVSG